MYNTAIRILKDRFEAEDIMQESFLTAFSKLNTFRAESVYGDLHVPFGSWLKRIVINKSLSQLKRNNTNISWNDNLVFEEDLNEIDTNFISIKVNEILKLIKTLKNNYRVILTLSLIEGFDNDEIAIILKMNNQQVRTTISRAKSKLRNQLNKHNGI